MPKILFYPEKRKSELGILRVKNVPILLFFSFEGHRLQYYSGERIDLKNWDFDRRLVLSSHPEHISINEHLDFLKRKALEAYRELKISGEEVSVANMRRRLKEAINKGKTSFFDLLIQFIEEKNPDWTLSTYRKIKTFYNHLRNFRNKTGIEPDLSRLDNLFFETLISYFRNSCLHIDSTIRKNLEVFLWFMNWAVKKGYHRNYDFRKYIDKYLRLNTSKREEFVLNRDEIQAMISYEELSKNEVFARDIFVLACLTGLSCQELRMLRWVNIEDEWIRITSGIHIRSIPLVPQAKILIGKYLQTGTNTLFPKIYPYKINRYLKAIAKKTNLTRQIALTKYQNGEELDATTQAYRLLTFSVARKSFINLALDSGIDPVIIAATAGFKTLKTLDKYSKKWIRVDLKNLKNSKSDASLNLKEIPG